MLTFSIFKIVVFSLASVHLHGHEENGMNSETYITPPPPVGTWNASFFPANSSNQSTIPAPLFVDRSNMLTGNVDCDDGKTNLCNDWCDNQTGKINYTCREKERYPLNEYIKPIQWDETIPQGYVASHLCMRSRIAYPSWNTTFGSHRPIYAVYGEYKFLPRQRWLHNCEHGAIVLLYHPCADPTELEKFKDTIRNCLRRYLITPYTPLTKDRPFALSAWGHALYMNQYNQNLVVKFVRAHALKGPENVPGDGGYKYCLAKQSSVCIGSDMRDSKLCPQF